MGAFFSNVQVFENAPASRENIISGIRGFLSERGFDTADSDSGADRVLLVGPSGRWISIHDSAADESTKELAEFLSRSYALPALSIAVYDSDNLLLDLFEAGELKSSQALDTSTRSAPWGEVTKFLLPGNGGEALNAALATDAVFVEERLEPIGALLGMGETLWNYLDRVEHLDESHAKLCFRLRVRPWEKRVLTGPPKVKFIGGMNLGFEPKDQIATGSQLGAYLRVLNQGGPGKGLSIVVWGEGPQNGSLEFHEARVYTGTVYEAVTVTSAAFTKMAGTDGSTVFWQADLVDAALPAGIDDEGEQHSAQFEQWHEAKNQCSLNIMISGKKVSEGNSAFHLGVFAHENPEAGISSMGGTYYPCAALPVQGT